MQTTEKLFTLALKGNVLAAQRFTAVALPPLVRLAWRMLGDQAEAEDIAQETFLRAWRKGQSWDPGGTASIMTWMHKTALNLCYDRFRVKESPTGIMPENMQQSIDTTPSALELLVRDETAHYVEHALQDLPPRQRAALILKHYEGLSQKEAAKIMGITPHALESLLARGRKTLKNLLKTSNLQEEKQSNHHDL